MDHHIAAPGNIASRRLQKRQPIRFGIRGVSVEGGPIVLEESLVKVLVVCGHCGVCSNLIAILNRERDIQVIGEVVHGRDLMTAIRETSPDVVVMEMNIPGTNVFQILHDLAREGLDTRLLILSQRRDRRYAMRLLHAGATGHLLTDRAFEELAFAVRAAMKGRISVSTDISADLMSGEGESS